MKNEVQQIIEGAKQILAGSVKVTEMEIKIESYSNPLVNILSPSVQAASYIEAEAAKLNIPAYGQPGHDEGCEAFDALEAFIKSSKLDGFCKI